MTLREKNVGSCMGSQWTTESPFELWVLIASQSLCISSGDVMAGSVFLQSWFHTRRDLGYFHSRDMLQVLVIQPPPVPLPDIDPPPTKKVISSSDREYGAV
ncbi:hypothetical protein ACO22_03748 [Paracoccidioides brasiliensis]|uniref:Uncharacterized protein n=1 Tax=Paracoccidioides brasiliensis TaxID=121759 RepID=A0A1D2JEY6_PARBR|nr:hypothetical protein ACO22_03748 [Paracoccidioides brasiliensis]